MKTKIFSSIILSIALIATIALSAGFASALTFGSVQGSHPIDSLTPNTNVTVTLTNDNLNTSKNVLLSFENVGFTSIANLKVTKSNGQVVYQSGSATQFNIAAGGSEGGSETLTISVSSVNSNIRFGTTSSATLKASVPSEPSNTAEVQISHFKGFCSEGPGRLDILEISDVRITNEGDNRDSDDDNWFPFDEIEIKGTIQNNGDEDDNRDDLDDLTVEIALLDSTGKNIIKKFEFDNKDKEKIKIGDLDGDEEEDFTFNFRLEDVDEDLEGNYDFVIKVYEKGNEDDVCVDFSDDLDHNNGFSQDISIELEDDEERFVRFADILVNPLDITCNDIVEVSADVINVGNDEVEDLTVLLVSRDLGINQRQTVSDLREGDSDNVVFSFQIPRDAQNKGYRFSMTSEYEVDDDPVSSDIVEDFLVNVVGCQQVPSQEVQINAQIESTPKAGEPLIVTVTFTNLGTSTKSVIVDAKDFDSWANEVTVSERIIDISPGQSRSATFTFDVKSGVSGRQTFNVEALSGNSPETQQIAVNFPEREGFNLNSLFRGNSLIWTIAIINIILLVLIVIVAVRLARR